MYLFLLPTTGHFLFHDALQQDDDPAAANNIARASAARANLRDVLKDSKRTDHELRDYPHVLKALDDYLPLLYAVIRAIQTDRFSLRSDPVFSWRTTLSSSPLLTPQNPRLPFPSIDADLRFSLLTYAFALSNAALVLVSSLGNYEHDPHLPHADREENDKRLSQAVASLRQASGVFTHLAEMPPLPPLKKGVDAVPDLSTDVLDALSKLSLAEAQSLAIRRLLSKSAAETALSPGPPLPASHPAPLTVAKLYLEMVSWLGAAKGLTRSGSAAASSTSTGATIKSKFRFGSKDKDGISDGGGTGSAGHGEVSADLRRYLSEEYTFASAMAHKWLGVDAGELQKTGEAVAFLKWAKEELEGLGGGLKDVSLPGASDKEKQRVKERKDRVAAELKSVEGFLGSYKRQNDSVYFKPVPKMVELQPLIPMGRAFVTAIPYTPPAPAFGQHLAAEGDSIGNLTDEFSKADYF